MSRIPLANEENPDVDFIAAYLGSGYLAGVITLADWSLGKRFPKILRDHRDYHERRLWCVPASIAEELVGLGLKIEQTKEGWQAAKQAQMYLPEINPQ